MKKKSIFSAIAIILIALGVWAFIQKKGDVVVKDYFACIAAGGQAFATFPPQCLHNEQFYTLNVGNIVEKLDEVVIESPRPYEELMATTTVTGTARGTWFFEATAPIVITAYDGTVLLQDYVQATADWMTTDFVPFEREISFDARGYTAGYFIFKKDNPSGLPENDDEVRFPIRFAQ